MHAITILRQCLNPLLTHIHARRLATLFEPVGWGDEGTPTS
ncbi:hypothetical protein [Lamprocystis purpurea]|jgi:hypothetical protein|nr:hypothetical protein [Lamprocystis purpurea]